MPAVSDRPLAATFADPVDVSADFRGRLWCVYMTPESTIALNGPSATRALLAGPVLPQTATVQQNGSPAAGKNVSISVSGAGGVSSASGTTDGAGKFQFIYIPPKGMATVDTLTATCSDCTNTASKAIDVTLAPESCPREPGSSVGNPINPASGNKRETATDYTASGPHPLNFTRYYNSASNASQAIGTGLGSNWSHNWAGSLSASTLSAVITLGDGSSAAFSRADITAPWQANTVAGGADALTSTASGFIYSRSADDSSYVFTAVSTSSQASLQSVTQRNGWQATLAYDAQSRLASVTNAFGRVLALNYSAAGLLTSMTPPDGQLITYSFDAAQRLAGVRFADQTTRQYHYEDTRFPQALTGVTQEDGVRYSTFSYNAFGQAVTTRHADGADAYTVTEVGATNAPTSRVAAGNTIDPALYRSTVQVTDPLGNQQTWVYQGGDGQVRVLGANQPYADNNIANRSFALNSTLPTVETDFLGVQTMYTWDLSRQLKTATTQAAGRPEAQTSITQWHPTFRLPVLSTEQGRATAYTYDAQGNKLSEAITDTATGQVRTRVWTYNAAGLPATSTDPMGRVTSYAYTAQGLASSMTNPLSHATQYAYDAAGRPASQIEPNGLASSYTYDARGRLLAISTGSSASLETTAYSYHPTGQLATTVLPSGYSTAYTYDAAQRLVAATDNRGNRISYTLDAMGNRVREETRDQNNTLAQATGRVINQLNRVSAQLGAQGQTTQLGYDANGQPISQTDPINQTTAQTLDSLKRPVATTFADNSIASQSYNQLDQLTNVTDPKGVATQYQRNAFGEVMTEASPDIGAIQYQRNAAGEVTSSTDTKGNITTITRDALGRPLTVSRGPNHITTYTYDTAGAFGTGAQTGYLSKLQDPSGSTTYERDSFGRITAKLQTINDNPSNPGSFKTSYTYDKGQLSSITYPSGMRVIYSRSTSGQVTGISTQVAGRNKPVSPFAAGISYTALGQPKAWSWASGDTAARSFDSDGRMTANEFASYTFDAASRITGITQNLWASRTVTQIIGTGTAVITERFLTPLTWQASYDRRNRIVGFNRNGATTGFSYDANSNRLTSIDKTTSDTDLDGDFDQADFNQTSAQASVLGANSNKLLGFSQTITKVRGTRTLATTNSAVNYSLDQNGNLTSDGLRAFDYDEANRLSKVKITKDGEAASITYLHNALGQRVFKGEPKADQYLPNESTLGTGYITWLKKNFAWLFVKAQADASIGTAFTYADEQLPVWAVLGEYDNGSAKGAGRTEYLWLPTEDQSQAIPVGMFRNGRFFAVHSDHLGTPRLVTDEQNKPVWQWPYSAFGNNKPTGVLKATTNPRSAITNQPTLLRATAATEFNLRFPGQYADDEAGSFYNLNREYLAGQGRYTQNDPIGLDGGLNRFGYVRGNPLKRVDPLGLNDLDITDGSEVPAGEFQSTNPLSNTLKPSDKAVCIAKCMVVKSATGAGVAALGYGALEVAARTGAISPLATVGLISVYKQYGKYYSTGKMALNLQQCKSECEEDQCKK